MKVKLVRAASFDPWRNMAVEEYLLNRVARNEVILYLWQVENTVMIGKHQNMWKECRCRQLEDEGGKLGRRLSGGGAVYQDFGTIIFSFILDRRLSDLDKQLRTVLRAVNSFDVQAEFSGRNDLIAEGRKFSGSAFYFKKESALHHGTLLINSDLTLLGRYLQVSKEKIASKGVDSVQARVINLADIDGKITVDAMMKSMEDSFAASYGAFDQVEVDVREKEIEELYQKHSSWEWRYGETPDFDISFRNRFPWGEVEIGLIVEDGSIAEAVVYSDAMDGDLIEDLARELHGISFQKESILSGIHNLAAKTAREAFVEDLSGWLNSKVF